MMQFDDVCYAYDHVPVLKHLNLTIEKGEAVALVGPNGSGKSTFLRLINGLIFPEIGHYTFEGTEITAKKMREHRYSKWFHQRVGFVFQDPSVMLFCATVREELAFGPEQMGLSEQEIQQRVNDAMKLFGIEHLAERTPYTLSGGEKKRVALAAVLTMNPAVWTLDEPLAALDEATAKLLVEFLQSLKKAGKTIIFSTHERELVEKIADVKVVFTSAHEVHAEKVESPSHL